MAGWNDTSAGRTQGVDPRLIEIMRLTRERTGLPFEISEGLRDQERQRQMVEQGKSQTYNSRHLTGNALDIWLPDGKGGLVGDYNAYRPIADAAKQVAAELGHDGFVWGGDWKTLKDGVHFQLGGGQAPNVAAPASPQPPSMMASTSGLNDLALLAAARPQYNALQLDPADFMRKG